MGAATFEFEPTSRLTIRTKASGLLGRLAHDLELEATGLQGVVQRDGERFEATLSFGGLRVVGVVRGAIVHPAVLSAADRTEIEARIERDVLPRSQRVQVSVQGSVPHGDAEVRARGRAVRARVEVRAEGAGPQEVSGTARLSLSSLGVPPIKGPLGAFHVADEVEVSLRATLRPAASEP